jgi:hypothetical protein
MGVKNMTKGRRQFSYPVSAMARPPPMTPWKPHLTAPAKHCFLLKLALKKPPDLQ